MFVSDKIVKKYLNLYKKTKQVESGFDAQAFFNVVNKGFSLIKDFIIDNDSAIDLNEVIEFYFFNERLWKEIKKIIVDYRKQRSLIIEKKEDSLEYLLEEHYKENIQLLKIKSFDSVLQVKNFFFYFIAGIFILFDLMDNDNKATIKLLDNYKIQKQIKELDHLLLVYEQNKDPIYLLIITLLSWLINSMCDILQTDLGINLKSAMLLTNNHQNTREMTMNDEHRDDKQEQAAIIPLKLTATKLKQLNDHFKSMIIGQDQVIDKINEILISEMYNISKKSHRPIGVLFFVGPTGVGKTETVKELAKFLYDSEQIHRFDMSEYKSEVAIQKLIGAPNGYVGYQEGGTLTNAMIKNPNTIVLFDEIEKADKSVFDLFLQMIDEGIVTSNKGVKCYFDNTIIVFTSNLGVSNLTARMGFDMIEEIVKENVEYFFNRTINRPELLGRIGNDNIVVFNLIHKKEDLYKILDIQFKGFLNEYENRKISLKFDKNQVYDAILSSIDLTKGARDIRNKFELFKKHLHHAFFMQELSIDELENKSIEFSYDGKTIKINKVENIKK